mmetsp:Transcript_13299/g.26980  ORF Transcript_13299/g.26980 Transcript_13299/m.26980 type:complete len:209 (+) Transcript_13299:557-1183(+)
MLLMWTSRICCRDSKSGNPTYICTSSRPGRSRAGSINSRRLVRPMTRRLLSWSTPSSLASSWFTTESRTPPSLIVPRTLQTASISSKTTTCRALFRPLSLCSRSASANSPLMLFSASPTHLFRISGPLTILGSRAFKARAISRANKVFPQPGGPYRSMPLTCCSPSFSIVAGGNRRVAKMRLVMFVNALSSPPTRVLISPMLMDCWSS